MNDLFFKASIQSSRLITRLYSTSFSLGVRMLGERYRNPIYGIYGFVRLADEIVDTFHDKNKEALLAGFIEDTYDAIRNGISINPVLNSFQWVVNAYKIDWTLIESFFRSMEMDLSKKNYTHEEYETYVNGSAEVVGLMCLKVFCAGNHSEYERLSPLAMKLGSAYQKINFLRDMRQDKLILGRNYFPDVDLENFTKETKQLIEKEIEKEFTEGLNGIMQLPEDVRLGVYLTYAYYIALLKKIKKTSPEQLLRKRIRISNIRKVFFLIKSYILFKLGII